MGNQKPIVKPIYEFAGEIKKHVATIHRANTLTLIQAKINNELLFNAFPNLLKQEKHSINIGRLLKLIGEKQSSRNVAVIRSALKALMTTIVEWNVINDNLEEEVWTASTVLASVRIKEGICEYSYSSHMRELLSSPKIYGKINMAIQAKFKSVYGLILYENCVRYRGIPATRWFDLSTLRKLMGVAEHKYPIFSQFKRRVLNAAIEENNKFSDIPVEAEYKQIGRNVVAVRFVFMKQNCTIEADTETASILKLLIEEFGLSSKAAKLLMMDYPSKFILEKMNIVKNSTSYQANKISALGAYLRRALQEDFKPNSNLTVSRFKRADPVNISATVQNIYDEYIFNQSMKGIDKLPLHQRESIFNAFPDYLKRQNDMCSLEIYQKQGFADKQMKESFCQFLASCFKSVFDQFDIESIEKFAFFRR